MLISMFGGRECRSAILKMPEYIEVVHSTSKALIIVLPRTQRRSIFLMVLKVTSSNENGSASKRTSAPAFQNSWILLRSFRGNQILNPSFSPISDSLACTLIDSLSSQFTMIRLVASFLIGD